MDEPTRQILTLWGQVLDALGRDPMELADRLDWVAKYALVRGYVAKGVAYERPQAEGARFAVR